MNAFVKYFRYADYTDQKIKWVKPLFDDWLANYIKKALDNRGLRISPILVKLENMTAYDLNYSICHFITEV